MFAGLGDAPVDVLRPLAPRRARRPRRRRRHVRRTAAPLNAAFRRGNVFATQFHPEKSATRGPRAARQLRAASRPRVSRVTARPVPGDRPARRAGGAASPGQLRRRDDLRRRPGRDRRRPSPTQARRGSTSSTSTRPAPAIPSTAPWSRPSPARSPARARVQTGGGVRTRRRRARARRRRCRTRRHGIGRGAVAGARRRRRRRRPRRRRARPSRRRAGGPRLDRREWRAGRWTSLGRYPTAAAFVITDIARDGMLERAGHRRARRRGRGDRRTGHRQRGRRRRSPTCSRSAASSGSPA